MIVVQIGSCITYCKCRAGWIRAAIHGVFILFLDCFGEGDSSTCSSDAVEDLTMIRPVELGELGWALGIRSKQLYRKDLNLFIIAPPY